MNIEQFKNHEFLGEISIKMIHMNLNSLLYPFSISYFPISPKHTNIWDSSSGVNWTNFDILDW